MNDEKNNTDRLNRAQLDDIKGGIPYEPPILVDLSGTESTCGVGKICSSGIGNDCSDGQTCTKGTIAEPE
jgi:hypothetical protein